MNYNSKSKYWFFFHVVFVYVIASSLWWSYLLHKNNYENYHELVNRQQTTFVNNGGSAEQFLQTNEHTSILSDFRRKELILYAEGFIFILLISLGFWRIRKTFAEEISLTHQQNNFLLSITHELKSPLASLKLSMQTMQRHHLDIARVKNIADMSMDDVDRLEVLVENILLASKIESSNFRPEKELINLSEITQEIFHKIKNKYFDLLL